MRLETETMNMSKEFHVLASKATESLLQQNVPVDQILLSLKHHNGKEIAERLEESINSLKMSLNIIGEYWSFFDHDLLSVLIKHYCGEDLKSYLYSYEEEFKNYFKAK